MDTTYNFDFNIDKSGIAKISVSSAGIAFSKESIELLGSPKRVNIGIDKKQGVLAVRKAIDSVSTKSYPFVNAEKKAVWLRINSKPLLEEIENITKTKFTTKSVAYSAEYDDTQGYLIVKLKNK